MRDGGYIKLRRSFLYELIADLPPEECFMLIYFMALANYEKQPKQLPKGGCVEYGQLAISLRWLEKHFSITKKKAECLLDKWERYGYIKCDKSKKGTIVTLNYYEKAQGPVYQSKKSEDTLALYNAILSANSQITDDGQTAVESASHVVYAFLGGQAARNIVYANSAKEGK